MAGVAGTHLFLQTITGYPFPTCRLGPALFQLVVVQTWWVMDPRLDGFKRKIRQTDGAEVCAEREHLRFPDGGSQQRLNPSPAYSAWGLNFHPKDVWLATVEEKFSALFQKVQTVEISYAQYTVTTFLYLHSEWLKRLANTLILIMLLIPTLSQVYIQMGLRMWVHFPNPKKVVVVSDSLI